MFSKEGCWWPFLRGFGCHDDLQKLRLVGQGLDSLLSWQLILAAGLLYALENSSARGSCDF
jgi:hypothetical protein